LIQKVSIAPQKRPLLVGYESLCHCGGLHYQRKVNVDGLSLSIRRKTLRRHHRVRIAVGNYANANCRF
jgi:hypothetical protein